MNNTSVCESDLADREKWEDFISKVIHEDLIPNKYGGWFIICYEQLKEKITHVNPNFREYYCAYYNVLADIVNNGEYCLNFAMILSFTNYWL